jgi:hypothetical protein
MVAGGWKADIVGVGLSCVVVVVVVIRVTFLELDRFLWRCLRWFDFCRFFLSCSFFFLSFSLKLEAWSLLYSTLLIGQQLTYALPDLWNFDMFRSPGIDFCRR